MLDQQSISMCPVTGNHVVSEKFYLDVEELAGKDSATWGALFESLKMPDCLCNSDRCIVADITALEDNSMLSLNVYSLSVDGVEYPSTRMQTWGSMLGNINGDGVLSLLPEPGNEYDHEAVVLMCGSRMAGYVPRKYSRKHDLFNALVGGADVQIHAETAAAAAGGAVDLLENAQLQMDLTVHNDEPVDGNVPGVVQIEQQQPLVENVPSTDQPFSFVFRFTGMRYLKPSAVGAAYNPSRYGYVVAYGQIKTFDKDGLEHKWDIEDVNGNAGVQVELMRHGNDLSAKMFYGEADYDGRGDLSTDIPLNPAYLIAAVSMAVNKFGLVNKQKSPKYSTMYYGEIRVAEYRESGKWVAKIMKSTT
jgi:hypothetical protein